MPDLFGGALGTALPGAVEAYLRETNPWWVGKPGPALPRFRRSAFADVLKRVKSGLAPCVVVRGPRQVGKTTLQEQLIEHLLDTDRVDARRILRVQFDDIPSLRPVSDPVLAIARWFQNTILKRTFNEAAHAGEIVYVFLDEVQNLPRWAPQLKALVDHHTLRGLVTGSSSLRIEAGRDSLAGRVSTVDLGTLSLQEIAGLRFGRTVVPVLGQNELDRLVEPDFWIGVRHRAQQEMEVRHEAFAAFSQRGGYPIAQARPETPWPEMADYLNETVILRAIQHDLRMGRRGRMRDEPLLAEVFRLACRYAGQTVGQAVFVPHIQEVLHTSTGWRQIRAYLQFLHGALLLRLVPALEIRQKKQRAPAKICLCDHGLRASWLQEVVPLDPQQLGREAHLSDLAGHLAESAAGYFVGTIPHLDLAHFPERAAEPEVDFVLTVGEHRIPMEIKYRRRIAPHDDTRGLRAFIEKTVYNAPFGVLVTMDDDVTVPDPRILPLSLSALLWMR